MASRTSGPGLVVRAIMRPGSVAREIECFRPALRLALWGVGAALVIGGVTAGIQIRVLEGLIETAEDPGLRYHLEAMESGMVRLILVDRLVPPGTLLIGLALCAVLAGQFLGVDRPDRFRRRAILVGLAPLPAIRLFELGVAATVIGGSATAGEVIVVPQLAVTGTLAALWPQHPGWVVAAAVRAFPGGVWVALSTALALRALDTGGRRTWHWWLPALSLFLAGITAWKWTPAWLDLVLRGP